eukprot:9474569-Alexandrium_andersonii.AAC.1
MPNFCRAPNSETYSCMSTLLNSTPCVASRHDWQSRCSEEAPSESAPRLRVLGAPTGLEQDALAQATD